MEKKTIEEIKEFSPEGFLRKRIWETKRLHCNIYCFEPGGKNNLHRHPVSDEVAFCHEGEGIAVVGDECQALRAGDTVLIPADVPHGFMNTSHTQRMVITVFQSPLPVEHVPVEPGDVSLFLERGIS